MEGLMYFLDLLILIRIGTGAVMCVFGYKWRKGLISIMALYIGFSLGMIAFALVIAAEMGAGIGIVIWLIITVGFVIAAYKNIKLNHFLTAFLVGIKLFTMLIYFLMEQGIIEYGWSLIVVPVFLSTIGAIFVCGKFTYMAVVCCTAYIGAVEVAMGISKLLNGTLFAVTGDFGFLFNPIDFILSIMGIEMPSGLEVILIFIIFAIGAWYQRKILIKNNIDLSEVIVDDRNKPFIK